MRATANAPDNVPATMQLLPVSYPREPKRCATNHEIKVYDIGARDDGAGAMAGAGGRGTAWEKREPVGVAGR